MYYFIVNPISGRSKKKKNIVLIKQYLDDNHVDYRWLETQYAGHTTILAKEITANDDGGNLIIVGGDGTFNEVINGVVDFDKWNIGLIPTGSGNDFASNIGLNPKDPIANLKKILEGEAKKTDYIKVNNETICINVIGTGIDVNVLENFEKHTKMKGSFRYFYSLLEALLHVKWYKFDLQIDDGTWQKKEGFITCVCNGSSIGGGIPICPGAKVDDNQLEFVFVNKVKKITILHYLIKLMSGKILKAKVTEHLYCKKVIFQNDEEFVMQIDGNIGYKEKKYICELVKDGIKIYR